ncbi:MAG: hypothetical protein RR459_05385 [Christensenellaceae bacterium]
MGILILLGTTIIFRTVVKKAFKQIYDVLNINCDVEQFYESLNLVINSKYSAKIWKSIFSMEMVIALIDMGKYEDAKMQLQSIECDLGKKRIVTLFFCSAKIIYSISQGNIKEAEENIDKFAIDIEKYKENKKKYLQYNMVKSSYDMGLHFIKKEYGKCTRYYYYLYKDAAESWNIRVNAAYKLGVICNEYHNIKKEKEYFAFVIEHGNNLYITQLAKKE